MLKMENIPQDNTIKIAEIGNQRGISMWPSLKLVTLLFDIANGGLILGLVIGVAATVILVWSGNKKEAYLNRELSESRERTADLEKQSDSLKLGVAK